MGEVIALDRFFAEEQAPKLQVISGADTAERFDGLEALIEENADPFWHGTGSSGVFEAVTDPSDLLKFKARRLTRILRLSDVLEGEQAEALKTSGSNFAELGRRAKAIGGLTVKIEGKTVKYNGRTIQNRDALNLPGAKTLTGSELLSIGDPVSYAINHLDQFRHELTKDIQPDHYDAGYLAMERVFLAISGQSLLDATGRAVKTLAALEQSKLEQNKQEQN